MKKFIFILLLFAATFTYAQSERIEYTFVRMYESSWTDWKDLKFIVILEMDEAGNPEKTTVYMFDDKFTYTTVGSVKYVEESEDNYAGYFYWKCLDDNNDECYLTFDDCGLFEVRYSDSITQAMNKAVADCINEKIE